MDALFAPYLENWLAQTDEKWMTWVHRITQLDQLFEPMEPPHVLNSSSVLDLFTAFQSGLDFLSKFGFQDKVKRERLNRNFVKTMSKTLERYCTLLYRDFANFGKDFPVNRSHIVKLNNMILAMHYLEEILKELGSDKQNISKNARRIEPLSDQSCLDLTIISAKDVPGQDLLWKTNDAYVELELQGTSLGLPKLFEMLSIQSGMSEYPCFI